MSRIEWLKDPVTGRAGHTVNPVKGLCPQACSYCYARRMYKNPRYKALYEHQEIRFDQTVFFKLPAKPSKIFVGSTMELFGPWVTDEQRRTIIQVCGQHTEHTFIFLTKCPQNLPREFPPNCWVGVSATDYTMANTARYYLGQVKATIKFLSIEPMLGPMHDRHGCPLNLTGEGIQWIIVGSQSPVRQSTNPQLEDVREIVEAADKAGVPVFEKNNLASLLNRPLRQEFPMMEGRKHDAQR